jgi:uncharacterized protein YhjY with autotransporter beta-barrel domain
MNSQMRRKASLLSRVSTIAVMAAAGAFGAAQQAQAACDNTITNPPPDVGGNVTISATDAPPGAPIDCVVISTPVTGNVTNQGVIGDPGEGSTPFLVTGNIAGQLINNGNILGGYSNVDGQRGALTIAGEAQLGGIMNSQAINSTNGNGIQIGIGGENGGHILGAITNTDNIFGGQYGIAALYGSVQGGLLNQANNQSATLGGGLAALYIADTFSTWNGGIQNFGQISGFNAAIQMGNGDGDGNIAFGGGISNSVDGVIDSANGTAILITNDVATFTGGITNSGEIEGAFNGIIIDADSFAGGFTNNGGGLIEGLSGDAIRSSSSTWSGNFTNSGQISGALDGFEYVGTTFTGDVSNFGNITAGFSGIRLSAEAFAGNVTNTGQISAANGSGLAIVATDISAGGETASQIRNTGIINAGFVGLRISGETVLADFTNDSIDPLLFPPGQISSESAAAVVLAASTSWEGDITNDGTLSGLHGMIVNGFSDGFSVFSSDGTYEGTITNNGRMEGDIAGLFISGSSFDGALINSGQLISTTTEGTTAAGLIIGVGTWSGNITNTSTGLIQGVETGALIQSNTFTGLITNDGVISGFGLDTGLHIVTTGTHTGDIVNNNLISASGNALHVEIGTHVGSIINTGTIEATLAGATAVLLEVDSGTTFENSGGGLVLGDIVFGGKAAYDFVGEDGGVEGSLIGQGGEGGNDDVIAVQNGTQYFIDGGGENGTASNFASFNVDAGGFAVMGATGEGASGGTGYSFSNVDALNVNNGGTLYIDKSTTLNVDNNYVQQAGGTLEFYLGAPSGISTASGTIIADPGDYGQILVGGTATLDGTIAGYLDPAFGSANPGLDIVEYNDVIVATGTITTDFSTLALINSNSIWELDSIIDGNTVDLRVQRTADLGHIGGLPGIVVETAGPWKSMVNDRSNGIGSGSCGLAGDGWCFNRFADAGAGQVMTDATPGEDPFGWLRTGVRRVGETAVWGRAVGVWGETDGDAGSSGTEFDVVGGIVGVDHVFTPVLLAGLAAQWTTSDVDFNGLPDNAEIDSFEVGAYASYGDTRLYLNANASVIWHDIEVNRFAIGGPAFGDYDGTTVSAYLEAGKIFETQSGLRIQPLVALSYAHLETDAYSETGGPGVSLLNVFESDFDTLKSNVGARFAYPIALQSGRKLVPEARLVWAHEFLDDQSSFLATIQGGSPTPNLIVGEEYSRDTIIVGTGITAPLSDATTLFIDYDAGLNDDITTHTVSAGFRTRW